MNDQLGWHTRTLREELMISLDIVKSESSREEACFIDDIHQIKDTAVEFHLLAASVPDQPNSPFLRNYSVCFTV